MERVILYQVRLPQYEHSELGKLAQKTGRTRAGVIRSLIRLAAADPSYSERLGELPQPEKPQKSSERTIEAL